MDRSKVANLIATTYTTDSIGQRVPTETPRTIFCDVASVSASEWFEAGRNGFKPQYRVTMFRPDYEGEAIVELEGERFSVYRTYERRDDLIELYLEKKGGV